MSGLVDSKNTYIYIEIKNSSMGCELIRQSDAASEQVAFQHQFLDFKINFVVSYEMFGLFP